MNRRSLGAVAIIIILLMVIVATAGLDNLPRQLRQTVTTASAQLSTDRAKFDDNRKFLERAIQDEPDLFQSKVADWRSRLDRDRLRLDAAASTLTSLQQLVKANKRTDADKVRRELAEFDAARQEPIRDTSGLRSEAERWMRYKRELPQRVEAMKASYEALKSFDVTAATAPAQKAATDWPAKKDDLTARLEALKKAQTEGEQIWESTAEMRAAVEAKKLAGFDYAGFFSKADRLDSLSRQEKDGAQSLNALAAQLYTSWDKLILDLDDDHGYREKLRIVRTRFPDSTLANGDVTNEEVWQTVDAAQFKQAERNVGMLVERKAAGKYDSESERVTQPPAYAYVAPPGQSNHYGAWVGGVWQWLPQYLILRSLLNASRGPVTTADYDAWQSARRRGEVFYGRNNEYRPTWRSRNAPNPGSSVRRSVERARDTGGGGGGGGFYKERPKPSYGGGSYSGSKYENRGSYSGSRYQSRGTYSSPSRSYSRGGGGGFSRGRR